MYVQSKSTDGFTLVELAIVLIIIGLLIGGTLKGQELITGARATATVSQIRAIEAGALTFLDTYKGFPGDLRGADVKLPNCSGSIDCVPVDSAIPNAYTQNQTVGNGRIDYVPGSPIRNGRENVAFFVQMFAADMIDGIDGTTPGVAEAAPALGRNILPAKIGSGAYYRAGYVSRGVEIPNSGSSGTVTRPGHYLGLFGQGVDFTTEVGKADGSAGFSQTDGGVPIATVQAAIEDRSIPVSVAQRIDSKYDDGNPNTGNIVAINREDNPDPSIRCADFSSSANISYKTSNRSNDCALYIRFAP